MITRNCETCGKRFSFYPCWKRRFCSIPCTAIWLRGRKTVADADCRRGYRSVQHGDTIVPEHRVIMERLIGRSLRRDEHVHHIDGNGLNNSPKNLKLMPSRQHRMLHNPGIPLPEQALATAYVEGATLRELAAQYDCSVPVIARRLRSRGIALRHAGCRFITFPIANMVAAYQSGLTIEEVAHKFGTSRNTAHRRLRAAGVTMRSPGYRHSSPSSVG